MAGTAARAGPARIGTRSSPPSSLSPAAYARQQGIKLTFPKLDASGRGGGGPESGFKFEAFHLYGDQHRKERLRHPVTGKKLMRWETRDDSGAWVPGLRGARESDLPIYGEADVRKAVAAGELVVLCESESSVDALTAVGLYATTWAGGAGTVHVDALRKVLDEHPALVVIPDHDEAGFKALATLRTGGLAPHVLVPETPGHDARDVLAELGSAGLHDALAEALAVEPGPTPQLDREAAHAAAGMQDGPSASTGSDPAADDDFDPRHPDLDPEREQHIAGWAAAQLAKHTANTCAAKLTRASAEVPEPDRPTEAVRTRAKALGGVGYYGAAGLDGADVIEQLVAAALAAPGEFAKPGEAAFRGAANTGWSQGVDAPLLPLDRHDPKADGHGVLPPAADMAEAVQEAAEKDPAAALEQAAQKHYLDMRAREIARERIDAERVQTGPRFAERLLTRSALSSLPPLEPLIADTLELGTIGMLAGPYGSCKSFVALSWAASIATGTPWHGRSVARSGPVVYVAGEGASGVGPRLSAWEKAHGVPIPDDALFTLPMPVNLSSPAEVAEFIAAIEGHRPIMVIFETLNRCAVGADESSATEMGKVIDSLYRVRAVTADGQGSVFVVHHAGKDGTVRGSTALPAAMDTVYQTTGDATAMKLTRTKRKDGEADDLLAMSLRKVGDSGVLEIGLAAADTTPNEQKLLAVMVESFSRSTATKSELRKAADLPSASFHRALNTLLVQGAVVDVGTKSTPRYRLAAT